jgi:glycosyltransferase involved in cell wall biosynthesis
MKKATITIIIPVFNVEKFVNETLLSVKNQISKPDEVIVINDGSNDGSQNILNNYRDLHGWKIIQTLNQGIGLTRNFGRSIAKSEYIYFLDSDDIIENNLIFRMREIIKQYNKPDMILFSGVCFGNESSNDKVPNLKFTLKGEYLRNNKLITKLVRKKESFPQVSRYITKIELWSKNELGYPKGIAEDEAVFFPLLALSKSTVVITETYYRYRVGRPDSLNTSPPNSSHAKDYLNGIYSNMEFMTLRNNLIKADLSSWRYQLGRKGLNYISMCLKTKTPISWITILAVFYRARNVNFIPKLLWRVLRYFFFNNKLKSK